MFYVKTETDNHIITTSYSTDKQARRYGGVPYETEMHLVDDGFNAFIDEEYDPDAGNSDIGLIRTIFVSKRDGSKSGRFMLYMQDDDGDWYYTGIFFASMSDANQAIKGPLSGCYGDMMIIENDEIIPTSKEEQRIYDTETRDRL